MADHGTLLVSLDFELHWGVRDKRSIERYRTNLLGVREAVPRMLEMFERYGVHATWATVGFLFAENKDELLESLPTVRPSYADASLDPYRTMDEVGKDERRDPFHYAASLIEQIRVCPGQEIGTHTFSHYYCLEAGQTAEEFEADIEAAVRIAARRKVALRSIVFPRNQVNEDYLPVCEAVGIRAYRGAESSRYYAAGDGVRSGTVVNRAMRLIDAYIPVVGNSSYVSEKKSGMVNLPSSRFLRPYSNSLSVFENLRLRRITAGMEEAARTNEVYHIWWHPHNFGVNVEENLGFLERILRKLDELREGYGVVSSNMCEVACSMEPIDA